MRILGIESSCDETAAAVVNEDGKVFSDVVASQIKTHAPYGGVVPELASRAHMRAIVPVIEQAIGELEGGWSSVDAVAVTCGPGLVGSLLVGIQVAKALCWSKDLPLVAVNHLDGHLLSPFLKPPDTKSESSPELPYIALLVSGGHTALYRVNAFNDVHMLGQTRDDAAGEAFDKAAKLLGLGYPGGPVIDRLAAQGDDRAVRFPVPMPNKADLNFSFSGLKTAVARHVQKNGIPDTEQGLADVCASFQRVAVEALVRKSMAACRQENISSLVLTGGVAANKGLRAGALKAAEAAGVSLFVPPFQSCTDNAAMIAYVGALKMAAGLVDDIEVSVFSRDPKRLRGKFRRDGSHV